MASRVWIDNTNWTLIHAWTLLLLPKNEQWRVSKCAITTLLLWCSGDGAATRAAMHSEPGVALTQPGHRAWAQTHRLRSWNKRVPSDQILGNLDLIQLKLIIQIIGSRLFIYPKHNYESRSLKQKQNINNPTRLRLCMSYFCWNEESLCCGQGRCSDRDKQ